jgi:hypothetical protein
MDQTSIPARKARWTKFLTRGLQPGFLFRVAYEEPDGPPWPPLHWEKKAERIDWALKTYERQLKRAEWLHDDFVPYVNPATGTEVFAEAFGCEVHFPEGSNPFAKAMIHSAAGVAAIKPPRLGSCKLDRLFEIADELRRRAGPDATMRTVDVQSPMDIATLIWDKNDFYIGMVESPEAIHELAGKVRHLLTEFMDEWFKRYGTGHVAHYPDYYMDGGMTLSEDEVGCVNPEMFDEFFKEELAFLSNRYGGLGMHCCARARHQWENFTRIPGLRLLNLHAAPSGPATYIKEAYDGTFAQMHYGWTPDGPTESWPEKLPAGRKYIIDAWANTREEALRITDGLLAARERMTVA